MFGRGKSGVDRGFERMVWKADRMILDDLVFRLRTGKDDSTWDLGDQCVVLFKGKFMMDKYRDFFRRNPQLEVESLLELGIYEGGSIPLWREVLRPKRMAAIDLRDPIPTPYLDAYVSRVRSQTAISHYWQFDQADKERLRKVVAEDLGGKLDMVIDDASHMYGPTLASFEALFPLVRPGGVYVIEDWGWNHFKEYQGSDHMWAGERSPSEVIFQILEGLGGMTIGIEHVEATRPFVAIFRDESELPGDFSLARDVVRRPQQGYGWW